MDLEELLEGFSEEDAEQQEQQQPQQQPPQQQQPNEQAPISLSSRLVHVWHSSVVRRYHIVQYMHGIASRSVIAYHHCLTEPSAQHM